MRRGNIQMKIFDVIKYEGDNKTFVWKYPGEDFNTLSKLIVHESQEAILFYNGQALDLFGPGEHILHTKNIPLLNKIINLPTGGESPFHCEVYFINITEQMAIPWGMGGVNYLDPTVNNSVFVIGASGELTLKVSDSRKLLTKLVGTESVLDQGTMMHYFKTPITMHIKSLLPKLLREKEVSIFEVEAYLPEFSELLKDKISREISDYGVTLVKFWINTINKPENDPVYRTLLRQRAERVTLVNQGEIDMQRANYNTQVQIINHSAETQKEKMNIDVKKYEQETLGYDWVTKEQFDVMKRLADNEGSGSDIRNALMGVGMGFGVGGTFGQVFNNIASSTMGNGMMASSVPQVSTINTHTGDFSEVEIPGMVNLKAESKQEEIKYSVQMDDKESTQNEMDSLAVFKQKIEKLKLMKESGLLSDEEFEKRKNILMDSL